VTKDYMIGMGKL